MACLSQVIADTKYEQFGKLAMVSFHESRELKIPILLLRFLTNPVKASIVERKIYDWVSPHPFV